MRLRIARIVAHDGLERRHELRAADLAGGDHRDARGQLDAILRVGAAAGARRARPAGEIAQRAQPVGGLAVTAPAVSVCGTVALDARTELRRALRIARLEIARLRPDRVRCRTAPPSARRCTSTGRRVRCGAGSTRNPGAAQTIRRRACGRQAPRIRRSGRCRSTPSASKPVTPSSASIVGAMSTSDTGAPIVRLDRHARAFHQERHAQRRVVHEDAVADLAMLAEGLAMIGGDDDQRGRLRRRQARRAAAPAARSAVAISSS